MKQHKCFKQANTQLKRHNTQLVINMLNPNQLVVATERIKRLRDGKRATVVIATFCPFCGERLAAGPDICATEDQVFIQQVNQAIKGLEVKDGP